MKRIIWLIVMLFAFGCAALQPTAEDQEFERLRAMARETGAKWSTYGDLGASTANWAAASSDSLLLYDPDGAAASKLYQYMLDDFLTDISAASATQTNKTIDADDNVLQDMPSDINIVMWEPTAADRLRFRLQRAYTASSIGCVVDPEGTGESVVVDVQECDSSGDNCATVLSSSITCANTPTAGTLSDTSWAANGFIYVVLGTVTGTVTDLAIYATGKESW